MDHQHQAHVVTTMNRSMLNDLHSLGDQAAIRLGALLGSDHTAQKTLLASNIGLAVVFLYVCCKIFGYVTGPKMSRLPRAGKAPGWFGLGITAVKRDFKNNGRKILDEGYRKYKNGMFLVQTLNVERVVLSPKYVDEINKSVPEDALDMADGLSERLLSAQTNLDVVFQSPLHIDVCKAQLTQNLHRLVEPIREEASYWLEHRIPRSAGETQVRAYETMVRIIAATGSRMLGGEAASRNPEWLETAALYSMDVVTVAVILRQYPAILRPLVAPWLEGTKKLRRHLEVAKKTFKPTFAQRLTVQGQEGQQSQQQQGGDHHEKPVDLMQWMVDSARGSDRDPDVLAHNMLFMSLAAVHTSSATTIHALFDFCANPQYVQPIRDEIGEVVVKHGWTLSAIASMKKLDSFVKESQRLNQAVLMTFNRRVARPIRFQDGTTLVAGTYLTMPSDAVARDPDIYDDPERFDGYRFYDRRMEGGKDANRHQFASTGPESLAFGQGKNACPGRFFAGVQIKVVLASVLINYDISFPPGQTERPKNLYKGGLVRPDPRQKLVFVPRGGHR